MKSKITFTTLGMATMHDMLELYQSKFKIWSEVSTKGSTQTTCYTWVKICTCNVMYVAVKIWTVLPACQSLSLCSSHTHRNQMYGTGKTFRSIFRRQVQSFYLLPCLQRTGLKITKQHLIIMIKKYSCCLLIVLIPFVTGSKVTTPYRQNQYCSQCLSVYIW